jgi:hypothetical protein
MSYLNPDRFLLEEDGDPLVLLQQIMAKKEFAMYAKPSTTISHEWDGLMKLYDINDDISKGNYLFLHAYQEFFENYFNPGTENSRILLSWQTGAGKTLPSLAIGINMLEYQSRINPDHTGHVIVLGFSHATFKKELLQYPELGFLSREELLEYRELQKQALSGGEERQEALQEFVLRIKRRFTSKGSSKSRFIFMGYKQFANRLFIKNPKYDIDYVASATSGTTYTSGVSGDHDNLDIPSPQAGTINITSMNEEEIREAIASGKIIVNNEIVEMFRNSCVICDESHKMYNSEEKNNWGIAISTILNMDFLNFRVIFISATPINNNPTEIVDLLNLLLPPPHNTIKREDLFVSPGFNSLRPGALQLIGKLTAGRVSFLQDQDPRFYPKRIIHGNYLRGVPLLKFVRCPMSKFHWNTYKSVYTGAIPQDSQNLIDFALPDPTDSKIGMFQSSQIITKLKNATADWKEKNGIDLQNGIIIGSILDMDRIKTYSTKYYELLKMLNKFIHTSRSGKIFIYHDSVYISGVLFIQELLKRNGFLDESMTPTDDSLCTICGNPRKMHSIIEKKVETTVEVETSTEFDNLVQVMDDITGGCCDSTGSDSDSSGEDGIITGGKKQRLIKDHPFMPIRFIVAHSDIDKSYLNKYIERFNHTDNKYGEQIRIIVGSQLMRESYDLKGGRKCIVVRRPGTIPDLIQIFGRLFRNYSFRGYPDSEWTIDYYILTSSCPDGHLGYEEEMYKRKILQYQVIQSIQRMMHIYAIDSAINYEKISKIFHSRDSIGIDILPYTPAISYKPSGTVDTSTYSILYAENEVDTIVGFIKRAFIEWSPVWKFEDLWKFISSDRSPISKDIVMRSSLISREYFAAALTRLMRKRITESMDTQDFVDKVFDPHERTIYYPSLWGSHQATIQMIGEYYILCPLGGVEPDMQYRHKTYVSETKRIPLNQFVDQDISMEDEWNDFLTSHSEKKFEELDGLLCSYSIEFHEYVIRRILTTINRRMSNTQVTDMPYWEIAFYVRLLLSYDVTGIIIWASQDEDFSDKYRDWITPKCGYTSEMGRGQLDLNVGNVDNDCVWCPGNVLDMYNRKAKLIMKGVDTRFRKKKKVESCLYPVGYSLRKSFLYNPNSDGWMEYLPPTVPITENDIIVGYDDRAEDELVVRFKIRNPIHKMVKHKDVRKLEKGTACSSKSKEYLIDLAKRLTIPGDKSNVQNLCISIRARLMYREILERQKPIHKRKKWFYYVYETHE